MRTNGEAHILLMICLSLHRNWSKVAGSVNESLGLVLCTLVKEINPYFVTIATAIIRIIPVKRNNLFLKRERQGGN